ncbi:MAG TPA: class IV adenylate cyclase [Pirellulales bacterium]|jgi:adenylate cyclase class 2|nr:class IV adenylate cyclase [Pirellulales bacterium]
MRFEVEQKFPISDLAEIERHLTELGATIEAPVEQADLYYAHPVRDFAQTDEALRIRRVGEQNFITYKGSKIDPTTKTRREIELPLASGAEGAATWAELLEALGFRPVIEVRKRRRSATFNWQGQRVEAALDEVEPLGSFVELEIDADEAEVQHAKACLASLAEELKLGKGERRSYLELLLGKTKPPSAVG